MKHERAISFSGKGGDVTSMNDVAEGAERARDSMPAEVLLAQGMDPGRPRFSAIQELRELLGVLLRSPGRGRVFVVAGALFGALVVNVLGDIRMNSWQGAFYRAIEHKNLPDIGRQSLYFVCIVAVLLGFVISQNWLVERLKIRLRAWLTKHLLDEWMAPGRAYRLNMTDGSLNPDQRIQEDVRNLSEMSADLGLGLARSALMLVSFIGVLWMLSRGITFSIRGREIEIPGYMVWFAMFYAAIGSYLAARVGGPLIALNETRYTREANFRHSLMRVNESAESIAFYAGEKDERKIVDGGLQGVLATMKRLSFANARLTWITCGHGWMVVILPVLVALPGYLQGKLDFGSLMMVVGAFNQVQQSLRWFVDNFPRIADWRAALHRVVGFRHAVVTVDEYENQPDTIETSAHEDGYLAFEKMGISLIDGEVVIADATAVILPGERVLLVGESGSGKSTLLRAVGGLWPWGSGRLKLPPKDQMMFLPQRPYMPLGTLAAALAYPNAAQKWNRAEMERCLTRVNLEEFIPRLDDTARWDKEMSLGQQQRLAFARLLLHRPKWIFLDESTSALDDENQDRMMSILVEDLSDAAVLSIGHRQGLERYHTRSLHLTQTRSGRVLTRKPRPQFELDAEKKRIRMKLGSAFRKAAVALNARPSVAPVAPPPAWRS